MQTFFLTNLYVGGIGVSEAKGSFSKWKDKINKTVNTLGSKTSYAMDRSKVRKQITQIQEEIDIVKQEIGDIVYKNRNNDFTLELVETQFVQIEDKETSIMQLEAQIEELNELIRLAGLEVEEETTVTCSKCKQLYEEPKKFCEKCGHQMVAKI